MIRQPGAVTVSVMLRGWIGMARQSQAHRHRFRVRYSETDQMGTFYNSRVLEWFECGRTELLRALGLAYSQLEDRGVLLPVIEAHIEYLGRARYDDPLEMSSRVELLGRARLRFEHEITHAAGGAVARGYTVHAVTDPAGKPMRPPTWLTEQLEDSTEIV